MLRVTSRPARSTRPTTAGLAHVLEHMAFNGTTHFKPGELVELSRIDRGAGGSARERVNGLRRDDLMLDVPTNRAGVLRARDRGARRFCRRHQARSRGNRRGARRRARGMARPARRRHAHAGTADRGRCSEHRSAPLACSIGTPEISRGSRTSGCTTSTEETTGPSGWRSSRRGRQGRRDRGLVRQNFGTMPRVRGGRRCVRIPTVRKPAYFVGVGSGEQTASSVIDDIQAAAVRDAGDRRRVSAKRGPSLALRDVQRSSVPRSHDGPTRVPRRRRSGSVHPRSDDGGGHSRARGLQAEDSRRVSRAVAQEVAAGAAVRVWCGRSGMRANAGSDPGISSAPYNETRQEPQVRLTDELDPALPTGRRHRASSASLTASSSRCCRDHRGGGRGARKGGCSATPIAWWSRPRRKSAGLTRVSEASLGEALGAGPGTAAGHGVERREGDARADDEADRRLGSTPGARFRRSASRCSRCRTASRSG